MTIIQVEFPVVETPIDINAEQLYDRCDKQDRWISSEGHEMRADTGRLESEVETDNDGNAFVLLFGEKSCQPGDVKIFADLEEAESFQTVHTRSKSSPRNPRSSCLASGSQRTTQGLSEPRETELRWARHYLRAFS